MPSASLVRLAILGEGLLVLVALVWARWRDIPLDVGDLRTGLPAGLAAAALLAVANLYLLCSAPDLAPIRSVRRLYVTSLKPLFAGLTVGQAVTVGVAAGVGEELLFRGVLQPEVGLVPASLIFGLLHTGGRGTLAFGGWVALMGAGLGLLFVWTGGLVAPTVAHALYDTAALCYIGRGPDCQAVRSGPDPAVETR